MVKPQILVTGGLGYIGSHSVVELHNAGYEPIIIDNLYNSTEAVLDALEEITGVRPVFRKVEMCNKEALRALFAEFPDLVGSIHFAAFLQVKESVEQPLKYYHNNLLSTTNLLELSLEFGVKNVVFSSSCTVYGNPESLPVKENESIKPAQSPYGNTKKIGEEILQDACAAHDLQAISLRYFNPIGAHPSSLIGEVQHDVPHHLVPYITQTAAGKRPFVSVLGGDYDTRDGSCIRDYIHVMDIARAHVNALSRLLRKENESSYEVYNLGSGNGSSVIEMIRAFIDATGLDVPYQISDRRPGDVEAVYADISMAQEKLGWTPQFDLKEMLKSAWDWEVKQAKN